MALEETDSVASLFMAQEIYRKKIVAIDTILKRIARVTPEEIKEVACDIFQNNKLNLALIGPRKNKKAIEKILYL